MTMDEHSQPEDDVPREIGNPARRALAGAGYTRLEDLSNATAAKIGRLHGVGPKAIRLLTAALARHGLALREDDPPQGPLGKTRQ